MQPKRIEEFKEKYNSKDTDELLDIWKANNRKVYLDEVFE
jgi:hypothetical protein